MDYYKEIPGIPKEVVDKALENYLCQFKEYSTFRPYPSMKEFFQPEPYEGMQEIVQYLKCGKKIPVSGGAAYDYFDPEKISGENVPMTDGELAWDHTLPYYIETYNLRLPEHHEKRLLEKIRAKKKE